MTTESVCQICLTKVQTILQCTKDGFDPYERTFLSTYQQVDQGDAYWLKACFPDMIRFSVEMKQLVLLPTSTICELILVDCPIVNKNMYC